MALKLRQPSMDDAPQIIKEGRLVKDQREFWRDHKPTAEQEDEFIRQHGFGVYGNWHLAIDDDEPADSKARYRFLYGDFSNVHRCAVLSIERQAGEQNYLDIENAAAHLHGMIDAVKVS
jgi:hypothetical protein